MLSNPWIPERVRQRINPRQRAYLLLDDVVEIFYAGAAGAGKTIGCLIAAAQFVDVPGYSALLLRENFADLNQAGCWIPESKSWWLNTKAKYSEKFSRWTFPSGATITFGYLQRDDDVYHYDSASFQFCGLDETTQHSEFRYSFLFGRLRRPIEGALASIPIRMRTGSNPGGRGHEWCKRRFVDPETRAKGAVFVPATLKDNAQNLDVEAYRRDSLSKLDPVTRLQREDGNWNAYAGGRFDRANLRFHRKLGDYLVMAHDNNVILQFKPLDCPRFSIVDPAASSKQTSDFTVIGTFVVAPNGDLVWLDCQRFQCEIPDIVPRWQQVCLRWRPSFVGIEAVASNVAVLQLAQRAKNPTIIASRLSPGGVDKLVRASPAINMVATGRVWLPSDNPNFPLDDVISELIRFAGVPGKDSHDDVVDVLAYAVKHVTGGSGGGRPMLITTGGGSQGLPWRSQSR